MTFPLLGRGGKIDDLVKEGNKLAELLHKKPALGLGDGIFGMELFLGELLRQEIFNFRLHSFGFNLIDEIRVDQRLHYEMSLISKEKKVRHIIFDI